MNKIFFFNILLFLICSCFLFSQKYPDELKIENGDIKKTNQQMQDEIDSVKLSIAEMYITPRNVNYGWGDNGVFQFKHNQKSIKKPYAKRKYQPLNYRDSVFELYYTKVQIPDTLYKNLIPKNKRFYTKRIMIILSNDTLYIDKKYNVIKQDKCYQITDAFKNFIIECMPIEIKENWINNLMYGQEGKAIIFDSDDG